MVGKTRPVVEHYTKDPLVVPGNPVRDVDPYSINARLEHQTSRLLERMENTSDEDIDLKTFYMSLIAIWRMRAVGVALRKEKIDEPSRGSAVRKYADAFTKAHDTRGRKKRTGPAEPEPEEPDTILDDILNGDDDTPSI